MTQIKSIFSINMIRARNSRGWSQREAAEKIGIKRSRLASYEEARREPSHDLLKNICAVYSIEDWKSLLTDKDFATDMALANQQIRE